MVRIGFCEFLQLHQAELFEGDGLALGLGHAFHFKPEGHIAERGAPRKQLGEILKHHTAVHAMAFDRRAGDADFAGGRSEKAGNDMSSVDLPHPLGPTMQRNSDAAMSKFTHARLARCRLAWRKSA